MKPLTAVVPVKVRWGPNDGRQAGIRVLDSMDIELAFVPWEQLSAELERLLLPQLSKNSAGYRFAVFDHFGKKDWIVRILKDGQQYLDVWFGGNPDVEWEFDGLVRIGDPKEGPKTVWLVYQRYSDGTYRKLPSRLATIDGFASGT